MALLVIPGQLIDFHQTVHLRRNDRPAEAAVGELLKNRSGTSRRFSGIFSRRKNALGRFIQGRRIHFERAFQFDGVYR